MGGKNTFWTKLFPPVSRDKFAALVCREIRRIGTSANPSYDSAHFRITERPGHHVYLENAYAEYLIATIHTRKDVIKRYATLASTTAINADGDVESFESVKADLLPKVRERFYHTFNNLHFEVLENRPLGIATRLLCEDLTLELIHDTPISMKLVSQRELDRWGITFEEAMHTARNNLWKRSNENFLSPRPGLYVSPWTDSNGASRVALHDLIWQLRVNGDHVAAVPNRDLLVVTGSEDVEGLLAMAQLVEAAVAMPRFMTAVIVRLNGTKWESYLPPVTNVAHERFRALRLQGVAREYAQQKELLEKVHKKSGRDVFVATASLYQVGDEKRLISRASWLGGIDSLLPRVDQLVIGHWDDAHNKARTIGIVEWEKIAAIAPELLTVEPGMYPARHLTNAIPTSEQLAAAGLVPLNDPS